MKADRIIIAVMGVMAAVGLMVGCDKEKGQGGDEPTPGPGPGPVVEDISGMWALLADTYRVQAILGIEKDGSECGFSIFEPAAGCYFYQDEIYGSIEGVLIESGIVGEKQWSLSGKTLTLGGKAYKKVTRLVGETYSSITTTLEDNSIKVGAEEQVVHIPYTISPTVPWGELTATKGGATFIGNIACGEGEVLVSVSAVQSAVSGDVTLHYPGAKDLAVTIVREITRAIVPEWTSKTYDYNELSSGVLPFTIVNGSSSYQAGVRIENDPDWIGAWINGSRVAFSIAENNSGASRTARLILSYTSSMGEAYPPAPEVAVTITQTYAAPSISLGSTAGETDFQEKNNITVPITVQNPRNNATFVTETEGDWLSCGVSGNHLTISVDQNYGTEPRSSTIRVIYQHYYGAFEAVSATYTLTQRGIQPVITLDPEEMTIDFHERSKWATGEFISFCYNVEYGSGDLTFTPDVNWITYPDSFWDNDHNSYACAFSVLSNDTMETRTGHITVTAGPTSKVFTLHQTGVQSGIILYEDEQTYNTLGQGGYIKFRFAPGFQVVTPYYDIQCTSNVDWLRPSGVGGQYGEWFSYGFNVDENNSGADREGILTFSIDGQTSYLKVIQTYTAPEIVFNDPTSTLGYQSGSTWIDCTIRWPRFYQEFSYETDVDWLTIEGGTYGITVQYAENKTNIIRSATITAHYMEFSKSITVTQGIREYFDLVLTDMDNSSVQYHINWASCNVGAPNGNLCGNYYTWSQAQSNLPSGSRLPTLDEWNDFQHAFTWTETSIGGINGFLGTPIGEANAWIDLYFIPASGRYNSTSATSLSYNNYAYYWSSTPYQNTTSAYWGAYFYYYNDQYGVIASRGEMTATFRVPIRVVK